MFERRKCIERALKWRRLQTRKWTHLMVRRQYDFVEEMQRRKLHALMKLS